MWGGGCDRRGCPGCWGWVLTQIYTAVKVMSGAPLKVQAGTENSRKLTPRQGSTEGCTWEGQGGRGPAKCRAGPWLCPEGRQAWRDVKGRDLGGSLFPKPQAQPDLTLVDTKQAPSSLWEAGSGPTPARPDAGSCALESPACAAGRMGVPRGKGTSFRMVKGRQYSVHLTEISSAGVCMDHAWKTHSQWKIVGSSQEQRLLLLTPGPASSLTLRKHISSSGRGPFWHCQIPETAACHLNNPGADPHAVCTSLWNVRVPETRCPFLTAYSLLCYAWSSAPAWGMDTGALCAELPQWPFLGGLKPRPSWESREERCYPHHTRFPGRRAMKQTPASFQLCAGRGTPSFLLHGHQQSRPAAWTIQAPV